jgi:hypothetical protein
VPLAGTAYLVATDGLAHRTPIDALGTFEFDDLPSGAGLRALRREYTVVVVADVRVGASWPP